MSIPNEFTISMYNDPLELASYDRPDEIQRSTREWLVVQRLNASGSNAGEWLLISDAAADLVPNNTMFGVLLKEGAESVQFLLVRALPAGVTTPGLFFPVDGHARISKNADSLELVAGGRHAHRSEYDGHGRLWKLVDVPHPAPGTGMAWHFTATEKKP